MSCETADRICVEEWLIILHNSFLRTSVRLAISLESPNFCPSGIHSILENNTVGVYPFSLRQSQLKDTLHPRLKTL